MITYKKNACNKSKINFQPLSPSTKLSFAANTIGTEVTLLHVFELKQLSQVTRMSMVQFQARLSTINC